MNVTLLIVLLYFGILLTLGVIASRRTRTIEDFYVAGKGLGFYVSALSSRATGESGWLLLGLTGMGWAVGVNAFWVLLGQMAGESVSWMLIARPFKRATDRFQSITIPDYLESRFRDHRHILRWIGALVIVVMVTAYLAAQLTASGKAFRDFLGFDFQSGVILGLLIVLFYTTLGGFHAVAWSDLFQGLLMLLGLILVPVVAVANLGGPASLITSLQGAHPEMLRAFGADGFTQAGVLTAIGFISPGLGYLGSPQLYTRMIAIRSEQALVPGAVVAILFTLFTSGGAIVAGMAGRLVFPDLPDQEAVFPLLAGQLFGVVLTGLFVAVVLAAVMSTADSLLILAVSAVVRDVYQKVFRPEADHRRILMLSRILTVVIAVVALLFSLMEIRLIFWFVLFAWAGISSAFVPVIVLSLFWRGMTLKGAIASMISGFLTAIIWKLTLGHLLYEMVPAFTVSLSAAVVVSLLDRRGERGDTSMLSG